MKKTILLCICLLLFAVIIPIFAGFDSFNSRTKPAILSSSSDEASTEDTTLPSKKANELTEDEIDYIICKSMEYIDTDSCEETKKAILALCKNNFIFNKTNNSKQDEIDIDTYSDDFLEELRELYTKTELTLLFEGLRVYIPISVSSQGYIITDEKYPYMVSVASPWDNLSEKQNKDAAYPCGVSVTGIDYLCMNGSDYKQSILWYLPKFASE